MRAVGIKALKDKLSEYIHLAAGGEVILVTDRDQVVAELGPPRPGRSCDVSDAVLLAGIREGWITPAVDPDATIPPTKPVAPLEEILRELREDRDAR